MIELLRESVLVQAILALLLAGSIVFLVVTGQEIPEILLSAFWVVLGYYFGSKVQQVIDRYGG
jgi:hypothetical protein